MALPCTMSPLRLLGPLQGLRILLRHDIVNHENLHAESFHALLGNPTGLQEPLDGLCASRGSAYSHTKSHHCAPTLGCELAEQFICGSIVLQTQQAPGIGHQHPTTLRLANRHGSPMLLSIGSQLEPLCTWTNLLVLRCDECSQLDGSAKEGRLLDRPQSG